MTMCGDAVKRWKRDMHAWWRTHTTHSIARHTHSHLHTYARIGIQYYTYVLILLHTLVHPWWPHVCVCDRPAELTVYKIVAAVYLCNSSYSFQFNFRPTICIDTGQPAGHSQSVSQSASQPASQPAISLHALCERCAVCMSVWSVWYVRVSTAQKRPRQHGMIWCELYWMFLWIYLRLYLDFRLLLGTTTTFHTCVNVNIHLRATTTAAAAAAAVVKRCSTQSTCYHLCNLAEMYADPYLLSHCVNIKGSS